MALLSRKAASNPDFAGFALALGSLSAVDQFVRANYKYRDEREEIVRTPEFMLNDLERIGYLEGDCDDVSTLYAAFIRALGYPARFVAIRYTPQNPNFEHVFTQAYAGGDWRTFDATVTPDVVLESLEQMTEEV
jgi:transglutaminase-like putative cysteine protease